MPQRNWRNINCFSDEVGWFSGWIWAVEDAVYDTFASPRWGFDGGGTHTGGLRHRLRASAPRGLGRVSDSFFCYIKENVYLCVNNVQ